MTEPILKVEHYDVDFWVDGVWYPAVRDMNFEVKPGEVIAIVGESGSGKSTTGLGIMNLLASNARTAGSVQLRGQELIGAPMSTIRKIRGKDVAYIFQEPMTALNPVYTVGFQITETLRTHFEMGPSDARIRAIDAMHARVGGNEGRIERAFGKDRAEMVRQAQRDEERGGDRSGAQHRGKKSQPNQNQLSLFGE